MKVRKLLTSVAVVVLLFAFTVPEACAQSLYAGWRDRSDELPGMISDGEMLLIAGGAVLVIGGVITYIIIKKKQDNKLEAMVPDCCLSASSDGDASCRDQSGSLGSLYNDICRATEQASVLFFSRLDKIPNPGQGRNNVLSMGVMIKF